jgi:pimeloyl-ACP methyl ester carboxylesterase
MAIRMVESWSRSFVERGYTVWWVTRKQNMPKGHSFSDMADDYGQLIVDELDGKVDLVLGMSTGGQIGFYLAGRHPDRFGHIAILSAAYEDNERAKALLLPLATLLSEGRTGEAMALMIEDAYPRLPGRVARVFGAVMGRAMYGQTHPHFANDVIVEAEAELACDARDILPAIPVPVLLVCGDRDPYFPKEICEETARLIPDCTLRLQEGKGHEMALSGAWFARDVLDFVRQRSAGEPGREEGRPPAADRPAAASEEVGSLSPLGTGAG